MKIGRKTRIVLIIAALLVLFGSVILSAYLFFSNYQNVQLLRQAERDFNRGDEASLKVAESQLLQLVRNDADNEQAFILLGEIAARKKIYPEMVYYTYQAHKLNPLSRENEYAYIQSLLYAREFSRLENLLLLKTDLDEELLSYLIYAAGQNGNFDEYRQKFDTLKKNVTPLNQLIHLLYVVPNPDLMERNLRKLEKTAQSDLFIRQEINAALANSFLLKNDLAKAEIYLIEANKLNEAAFAPALARFYANFRSMGKAIEVFEKYLATYHDPMAALQYGELCCLLKQKDKIAALRTDYQSDSGKGAMLLCYYLEVLEKFTENDIDGLKPLLAPLQDAINTPLACYIFFCAALDSVSVSEVFKYYNALFDHRDYLDLKSRASRAAAAWLKEHLNGSLADEILFADLAAKVYPIVPDAAIGKYLLLTQRQKNMFDIHLLADVMKRFPEDRGVHKIAIEHYLSTDLLSAEKVIRHYEKVFPKEKQDMLRYKIVLAIRRRDFNKASALFQQNFSPELANGYWNFAVSSKRIGDLQFLGSKLSQYQPFCKAAVLFIEGKKEDALQILASADAKDNLQLCFYAAKTLGENGKSRAALEHYSKIPPESPYKLSVLLNCAELQWEINNKAESLRLAQQAYELAPDLAETQYCYADKLYKSGQLNKIAEVVKISASSPYQSQMKQFLIASLVQQLKNCDFKHDREKISGLCERLKRLAPGDKTVEEVLERIRIQQNDSGGGQK